MSSSQILFLVEMIDQSEVFGQFVQDDFVFALSFVVSNPFLDDEMSQFDSDRTKFGSEQFLSIIVAFLQF